MRPGEVLGHRFELVERLLTTGVAGMWRAFDRERGEDVAIKTITGSVDPHALDRFRLEAGILQSLIHPNIARYIGFGLTPSGEHWIAQEWCSGLTLRRTLDRDGLTACQAVSMARQVASALGEAHAQQVVHRDIKPGNILAHGSSWVVVDFGVARVMGEEIRLTRTGTVVGTPGYMSPEQARAEREIDARADVFALGCVLYEALAGRPPFVGDNALGVRAAVLAAEHPPLAVLSAPGLPTALTDLVERCLRKEPAERPADGGAIVRDLLVIEEAGLPDTPPRKVTREEPPTILLEKPNLVSVVVAGPLGSLEPAEMDAWRKKVKAACPGGDPAVLPDGAVVYRAGSLPVAADAALALRRARPGHPIAIATCDESELATTLAATGVAIERATYAALFADATSTATSQVIRIDATTAGQLGREFMVTEEEDAYYLVGRRPRTERVG